MATRVGLKSNYDFDNVVIECETLKTPILFGYLCHDYFINDTIHTLPQ
jgi:hypothetical protein